MIALAIIAAKAALKILLKLLIKLAVAAAKKALVIAKIGAKKLFVWGKSTLFPLIKAGMKKAALMAKAGIKKAVIAAKKAIATIKNSKVFKAVSAVLNKWYVKYPLNGLKLYNAQHYIRQGDPIRGLIYLAAPFSKPVGLVSTGVSIFDNSVRLFDWINTGNKEDSLKNNTVNLPLSTQSEYPKFPSNQQVDSIPPINHTQLTHERGINIRTYNRNEPAQQLIMTNGKETPYFTVNEVRCTHSRVTNGAQCPIIFEFDSRLVDVLHNMRIQHGPISLSNAFRCSAQANTFASGTGSRHAQGKAADIRATGENLQNTLYDLAISSGSWNPGTAGRNIRATNSTYISRSLNFVHVSVP